jgi:hypothetical protein
MERLKSIGLTAWKSQKEENNVETKTTFKQNKNTAIVDVYSLFSISASSSKHFSLF